MILSAFLPLDKQILLFAFAVLSSSESLAAVISRADRTLYQAKRAGRNRSLLAFVAGPLAAQAATISE